MSVNDPTVLAPAGKLARLIQPTTFEEAFTMAKRLALSSLVPKAYQPKLTQNMSPDQRMAAIEQAAASVVIAWEMGAEVGMSPMTALQSIAVIGGKPVNEVLFALLKRDWQEHRQAAVGA